jgi:hypothetical protein
MKPNLKRIMSVLEPDSVTRNAFRSFKHRMKRRVTAVVFLFVLFFVGLYVPDIVLGALVESLNIGWRSFVRFAAPMAGSISMTFVLQWIIFSQDSLATGSSKKSRFFRACYPSTYARNKYGLMQGEADRSWFDYFNQWQNDEHPNHSYHIDCFKRSYSCRLIYYLSKLSIAFTCGAIALMVFTFLIDPTDFWKHLLVRLTFLIAVAILFSVLAYANRISEGQTPQGERNYQVTGVWFKYQEINGVLIRKFEMDILTKRAGPDLSKESSTLPA